MPIPRGRRRGRRIVVGMILGGAVLSLVGLTPIASYAAGDDYPYAGLGQCPLVPLPKPHRPPGGPDRPGGPVRPGTPGHPGSPGQPHGPHKPGQPPGPGEQTPPPPPPPRVCAKHIWFYNGSYGDPWGFALRNCTSFVAWRLRTTNGMADFENHFGGVHWGNANHWDDAAASLGYLVDKVPAVGAVAQTDDGRVGHVTWVSAVGEGTVTVEEYNHAVAGGYDVRTLPTSSFRYLHLADTAPAPYLGSTRAGVATPGALGSTWSASTRGGDLVLHRPSDRTMRLGARGTWSAHAAPSIATDAEGRIWVAAVGAGGRVLTTHTQRRSGVFSRPRPVLAGSTTSSPALVTDDRGRIRVFAVTAAGNLLERHVRGDRPDRWSRPQRMGFPGSWSTHAAPAAVTDAGGSTWVAAVTRRGRLLTRHTTRQGRHWTGLHSVDRRVWSSTSTPALAIGADGRVWLAAVGRRGALEVWHTDAGSRRWQRPDTLRGRWSPYSSPALAVDRTGRTWIAAVTTHGDLAVRSNPAGKSGWHASRGLPRVPETYSPGLTSSVNGVLVGVTDRGHAIWRRPLGPSSPLPPTRGPHSDRFSVSRFL